ncbi:MAG: ABC transporter ATP-binding protein, partial [Clostridiaceae bacterium]|nr:ABC transporter ATP-binding protein [Clostridiaceae bacterium]
QVKAVDGVSLTVGRGEFLVIMGKSGSGKSTLLHLLGGLDRPDVGEVRINDTVITSMKEEQLSKFRAQHLGFVFQFFYLLPELTAAENICLPLLVNRSQQNLNEREITALTDLLGITERLEHRPEQLSGGEQQRVALARALANRPEIIMLDEPTGNLDSRSTEQIMRMIAELVSTRTQTVIMVTHDRDWCDLADRVLYMRDGHLIDAATYAAEQGGRHA